jgi:WHG domain-containing protein
MLRILPGSCVRGLFAPNSGSKACVTEIKPTTFASKCTLTSSSGWSMSGPPRGRGDPLSRLEAMGGAYVRFALAIPHRYRLMFGAKTQSSLHLEVHEAAHAIYEWFVRAIVDCQEAGELPAGDPVELAALLYATSHGAEDLALSGQTDESNGLQDPMSQLRLLLAHLRVHGRAKDS